MHEGLPKSERAPVIKPTEEVLADFSRKHDDYREAVESGESKHEAYAALHGALEHFENGEMVRLYEEGRIPTFSSLDQAVMRAREELMKVEDPESAALAKLLSERASTIKRWCRRYVSSILRFRSSHLAMLRSGEKDERDAFREADEERRRIHNSLLESLASLNTLIMKSTEYVELPLPHVWEPYQEIPENTAWEKPMIFSGSALADRDLIRDWAIVADREEEIRKLTGYPPLPK